MAKRIPILRTYISLLLHAHQTSTTITTSSIANIPPTAGPFLASKASSLINPHRHRISHDAVSILLPLSAIPGLSSPSSAPNHRNLTKARGLSQHDAEILLARLLKGFFAGWIFRSEFILLHRLQGWRLLAVDYFPDRASIAGGSLGGNDKAVTPYELANDALPVVGQKITGSFQVVDWSLRDGLASFGSSSTNSDGVRSMSSSSSSHHGLEGGNVESRRSDGNDRSRWAEHDENGETGYSYVDIAFGSSKRSFSGCHRLAIRVLPSSPSSPSSSPSYIHLHHPTTLETATAKDQEHQLVEISLSGFVCNPTKDKTPSIMLLKWFHLLYARLLFVDGVLRMLRD